MTSIEFTEQNNHKTVTVHHNSLKTRPSAIAASPQHLKRYNSTESAFNFSRAWEWALKRQKIHNTQRQCCLSAVLHGHSAAQWSVFPNTETPVTTQEGRIMSWWAESGVPKRGKCWSKQCKGPPELLYTESHQSHDLLPACELMANRG